MSGKLKVMPTYEDYFALSKELEKANKDIQILVGALDVAVNIIEKESNANDYSDFRGKCKKAINQYKAKQ